jgi:hypothetical protein
MMGTAMMGHPTRFEQRNEDYMRMMGLDEQTKVRVREKMAQHKSLLGQTIKDIFICNRLGDDDRQELTNLWLFTSEAASEIESFQTGSGVDFINHMGIEYAKFAAKNCDLITANKNSDISLLIIHSYGRRQVILNAYGYNCMKLIILFKKYFSRHLAP